MKRVDLAGLLHHHQTVLPIPSVSEFHAKDGKHVGIVGIEFEQPFGSIVKRVEVLANELGVRHHVMPQLVGRIEPYRLLRRIEPGSGLKPSECSSI